MEFICEKVLGNHENAFIDGIIIFILDQMLVEENMNKSMEIEKGIIFGLDRNENDT